jgi:hypothetical protein
MLSDESENELVSSTLASLHARLTKLETTIQMNTDPAHHDINSPTNQSLAYLRELEIYITQRNRTDHRRIIVDAPSNPSSTNPTFFAMTVHRTNNCQYDNIKITCFRDYRNASSFPDRKYVVQFDRCGQSTEWSSSQHFDARFFETKEQVAEFLIRILYPGA